MAETARAVITDALTEILVGASEQPFSGSEIADAIRYLNRMMFSWEAQGKALGFTKINDAGDLVTIPDAAIEGVVFNLALRLAPQYDVIPSPDLRANAATGLVAIRNLTIDVGPSAYPSTLPIGSGNEQPGWNTPHFYPEEEDGILAETTGAIVQEYGDG